MLLADLLAVAVDAARQAGDLLRDRLGTVALAATKTSPTDAVTQADRDSEALILGALTRARPDDGIIGEEGTAITGTTGIRWVVDPLDGTVNYLYAHPSGWAVAIAAEDDDGPLVGVVYDPARDELFAASRGEGARCNGRAISVSPATDLSAALVGTGFGYVAQRRRAQAAVLQRVLPAVRDIRRGGSAALDLCWTACGRLDAFYEVGLQHWDWSAASLVVREAGGQFLRQEDELVVAAPPALFGALHHLVR